MTLRDLLVSAGSGLLQQKLRTLLTLGGVILGAMLLFCSLSGGLGVLNALQQRLAIGDRLLTVRVSSGFKKASGDTKQKFRKDIPSTLSDDRRDRLAEVAAIRGGGGEFCPLTLSRVAELSKWEGVAQVTPELRLNAPMIIPAGSEEPIGNGTVQVVRANSKSVAELLVNGDGFSSDSAKEILISENFLYRRGFKEDADFESLIGQSVNLVQTINRGVLPDESLVRIKSELAMWRELLAGELTEDQRTAIEAQVAVLKGSLQRHDSGERRRIDSGPLTVAGIYKAPSERELRQNPTLIQNSWGVALVPLEIGKSLWLELNQDGADRQVRADLLASDTRSLRKIVTRLEDEGFRHNSLAALAQRIRTGVLMVTAVITLIAGGAFLIAAIGMMNTMIMNVLERRREIGILKSIGARDRDVLRMFLLEGLLVGLIGGLVGLAIAAMITRVSGGYVSQFLEQRLDEPIDASLFVYPTWLVIGTPILASLVTTVASILPARRAARLDPVQTLRSL